ncbi:MAG TPA: hypothetical protein VK970_01120 [Candidatus Methylacidiphilales bacterium]|nr:hypothetical protein [Candidatus Methylacidiphilales bacterium]
MPLIEILSVIALLLVGGGLFYYFYWVSTAPVELRRTYAEPPPKMAPARPPLKFASPYDYLRRAYFAPFLILIPLVVLFVVDRRYNFASVQLYVLSAVHLYFITSSLQYQSVYSNGNLFTREENPQAYWEVVRFLLYIYFGMNAAYLGLLGLMECLLIWWPLTWR